MKGYGLVKDLADYLASKGITAELIPTGRVTPDENNPKLIYYFQSMEMGRGKNRQVTENMELTMVSMHNNKEGHEQLATMTHLVWDYLWNVEYTDKVVVCDDEYVAITYQGDDYLPASRLQLRVSYEHIGESLYDSGASDGISEVGITSTEIGNMNIDNQ